MHQIVQVRRLTPGTMIQVERIGNLYPARLKHLDHDMGISDPSDVREPCK